MHTVTSSDPDATDTTDDIGPVPQLVFAHLDGGRRPPQRRPLMRPTLDLGRGADALGAGPLDDRRMSRHHARIERRADGWWLCDLGSRNGSAVNGERLDAPRRLADADVIRLGDTLIVFRLAPLGRSTPLPEDPAHPLLGVGPDIARLRADLAAVAPRDLSVLVLGETGTGKEVVARTLHAASGRAGRFVAVNCAAMPAELLESTLFGHVRGAFTGADAARPGLIREADGGTLLLDELGEMPAALQAKLLRALETRSVRPVGGTTEVAVDARVISATHRDLADAVRAGRFRLDLYGRLAHWTIRLPPLRARPEDVPLLAARFAGRPLDAALVEALMLHPWPLNVRGLRALIARAAVRAADDGPLRLGRDVREALAEDAALLPGPPDAPPAPAAPAEPPPPRDPPSAEALRAALSAHQGRVAATARALDASRQQVYRWIALHGLDLADFRG